MTALNDLSDVNAPTPADLDRLVYDNATSKWIPLPSLQAASGTITYPAGATDGGDFTYFSTLDPTWDATVVNGAQTAPEGAKIGEFTVTAAMVNGIGGVAANATARSGIALAMYGVPTGFDGLRTFRFALRVKDGPGFPYTNLAINVGTTTVYMNVSTGLHCVENDVVEVFAWKTSGTTSEKVAFDWIGVAPAVLGLEPGAASTSTVVVSAVTPGATNMTAPTGFTFAGATPIPVRWYRSAALAGETGIVENNTIPVAYATAGAHFGMVRPAFLVPGQIAVDTSGSNVLSHIPRLTTYNYLVASLPYTSLPA